MANMAPQTAYQGSSGMKRLKEGSKADKREDRKTGEGGRKDTERAKRRTVAAKGKLRPRVSQTPFGGDDLGGM